MAVRSQILAAILVASSVASAQVVASHKPAVSAPKMAPQNASGITSAIPVAQVAALANKAVVRVNGAVLSELDLQREMYAIFPYASVHSGIPKDMEPQVRKGAMDMIIFEELLYQEAKRRNLTVPAQKISRGEAEFRKQFPTEKAYQEYMSGEMKGSQAVLREKIRRSFLIEQMLKTEVKAKSNVTSGEVRAYYDKNSKQFEHGEMLHIQTISIIPPNNSPDVKKEARKRADTAYEKAKTAKSYQEFGLVAEKFSDDDWHVNMGDRKPVEAAKLPPEVLNAARTMKPGSVSPMIQIGDCYTMFRLIAHETAGKTPFAAVQAKLRTDMQKEKTQLVRSALGQSLRKNAKIEIL